MKSDEEVGVSSQTPTVRQDMTDDERKSEKLGFGTPDESGNISESPPSDQGLDAGLAPAGPDPNDFPDGGFEAWFCIAGGFGAVFSSFGWVNCM